MSDEWGTSSDTWGSGGGDSAPAAPAKDSNACFKCNETGHRARDCPSGGGGGGSGDNTCRKCGEAGHFARDCSSEKSNTKEGCRNCGEDGHFARECPQKDKCRRCGGDGHKAAECTEPEKTRQITTTGEDGVEQVREIYVPVEQNVDDLYGNEISAGINFSKYSNIAIDVTGDGVVPGIESFKDAGLREFLLNNISKCGYKDPTPVQKRGIPIVMAGRDLMACAQTGSGKTAAFLLPIINKLIEARADQHAGEECQMPQAVVMSPTRELAMQIMGEAQKFSHGSMVKPVIVYGGTSVQFQRRGVQRGCNILIATPGRLKDFVEKGWVSFSEVKYLVLDEADRMLDMGFSGDIKDMVNHSTMPNKKDRVTLMFSATFPEEVQISAQEYLNNYLFLRIGLVGGACSDVEQIFIEVDKTKKRDNLLKILNSMEAKSKVIVFVNTKKTADFIAAFICGEESLKATSIHGDRLQRQREEALQTFRTGEFPILVATAVAARGLDIKGVDMVVNFDMPTEVDEYVHRIGRTGRMGNLGKAISLFDPSQNADIAAPLVHILTEAQQNVPEFLQAFASGGGGGAANLGGSSDMRGGAEADDDGGW